MSSPRKRVIPGEEDSGLSTEAFQHLEVVQRNERQKRTEQEWSMRQAKAKKKKKKSYFEVKEKMGQLSQGQTHVHYMLHTPV